MGEKIMGLIELAMKFKGEQTANVEFIGSVSGVEVSIFDKDSNPIYMEIFYLDCDNARERLISIKEDLEKMLKEVV